ERNGHAGEHHYGHRDHGDVYDGRRRDSDTARSNVDGDRHRDGLPDGNPDRYSNRNADGYANAYRDGDGYANRDGNAHGDTDPHRDGDSNRHANTDCNADGDGPSARGVV